MGFFEDLIANPMFQVFIIAAVGYMIGAIRIKGIEIGDAAILLVALVAGHFGASVPSFVNNIGVALFVASVGLIAGPRFFHNFLKNAKSYVLLGAVIILAGTACAAIIVLITGIDSALAAGLMSGAMTSTPGLAAAQEAAGAARETLASVGYGVAYPFGVIGVVLFVQLLPKILKVNVEEERRKLEEAAPAEQSTNQRKLISVDHLGMMPICLTIVFGVILGAIVIPLPGGASFSLGTSGGPLVAGLIVGHFNHIGKIDLKVRKNVLECMREFGLILFLIAAGVKGGAGFVDILAEFGPMLFLYGAIMTIVPMVVGYFFARYVLKLSILDNMGALCGGMTSTPALGTLIQVAGTDDVATSYASTYPIALVAIVLLEQLLVLFL